MGVGAAIAGVSLLKTGVGMYSSYQSGKTEQQALEYQAELTAQDYAEQARLAELESGGLEIEKGQLWSQYLLDKSMISKIQAADVGKTVSDTGARGVKMDLGVISDINREYELDKAVTFQNLKLRVSALDREQMMLKRKAELLTTTGSQKYDYLTAQGEDAYKSGLSSALTQGVIGSLSAGFGMYSSSSTPTQKSNLSQYTGFSGTGTSYINKKYGGYF